MKKFVAKIHGARIISVSANSLEEASAIVHEELSRPGRNPIFVQWVANGKVLEEELDIDQMLANLMRWTYAGVKAGFMVRKSDQDRHLMKVYGVDECTARDISNRMSDMPKFFETGRDGCTWLLPTPEPGVDEFIQ